MDNEQMLAQIAALIEQSEERTVQRIQAEVAPIKQQIRGIELTLENETNRKINLMYESHQTIIEKQKKISEIDDMKDRIADLERAVKVHTAQIAELKKAE